VAIDVGTPAEVDARANRSLMGFPTGRATCDGAESVTDGPKDLKLCATDPAVAKSPVVTDARTIVSVAEDHGGAHVAEVDTLRNGKMSAIRTSSYFENHHFSRFLRSSCDQWMGLPLPH